MKNVLLIQALVLALLSIVNIQCEVDNAGVYATKAYAKNSYNAEGTAYSCAQLLSFSQCRDGSSFEPEEWMKHYLECAEQYPRFAEKGLLGRIVGMLASEQSRNALKRLKENKFGFSEIFRRAMRQEIISGLAQIIYPILLDKQAEGFFSLGNEETPEQWSMRDVYFEIEKVRPNCQQLEEFMSVYGTSWDVERVRDLCEMQNVIAPDLVPR